MIRDVARAYRLYEGFKADRGLLDFGDMQHLALKLLQDRPAVLERLRGKYRYVIVDEFQDTDYTQLQIVLAIAEAGNITVVGDDDQSIYRFRGAYLTNVHEFTRHYRDLGIPPTDVVLTRNYRCTGSIQSVASSLIDNNPERRDKEIVTEKGPGEPVTISRYEDDWAQAMGIVGRLRRLNEEGYAWDDMAVLVRRRADARPIVEALERTRVPFEVLGSREYFRHPTVRAAVSYLRVIHDPAANQPSLGHVMLRPVHGISPGLFQRFCRYARDGDATLWEALGDIYGLQGDTTRLVAFRKEVENLFAIAGQGDLLATVRAVLFGKDLFRVEIASGSVDGVRVLNRFMRLTSEYTLIYPEGGLGDLITYLETLVDLGYEDKASEPAGGAVRLMTIHGAKGREFPVVLIPSLSQNRLPARYQKDRIPIPRDLWDGVPSKFGDEDVHYQEERRLLYVGITRGKERVFLSTARRYGDNKRETPQSRFLDEFGDDHAWVVVDEAPEAEGGPEVALDSVDQALGHALVGEAAHGDWQAALDALVALARVRGSDISTLAFPAEVDVEAHIQRVRDLYSEPDRVHAKAGYYTPTRLRAYEECPARYRYAYVLGIPDVQRTFFALGTVVHEVIELITKRIRDGVEVNEGQALQLLDEAWSSAAYPSREKERQDREEAERMVREFLEHQGGKDTDIVGIELFVEFEIDGRTVRGKVDRIDDLGATLEVIDYKTSKTKTSRPKLKEDFQMVLYWEGAERALGKPVSRVGHWYLREDREWMVEISAEERQAVMDRAKAAMVAIEAGSFAATPAYRTCMYCGYADLCDDRYP